MEARELLGESWSVGCEGANTEGAITPRGLNEVTEYCRSSIPGDLVSRAVWEGVGAVEAPRWSESSECTISSLKARAATEADMELRCCVGERTELAGSKLTRILDPWGVVRKRGSESFTTDRNTSS